MFTLLATSNSMNGVIRLPMVSPLCDCRAYLIYTHAYNSKPDLIKRGSRDRVISRLNQPFVLYPEYLTDLMTTTIPVPWQPSLCPAQSTELYTVDLASSQAETTVNPRGFYTVASK